MNEVSCRITGAYFKILKYFMMDIGRVLGKVGGKCIVAIQS